jgi:hypothetical protein
VGLDNIIRIATAMTIAAALTGQLPRITNEVRKAQVKLLRESKASAWGQQFK